MPKQTSRLLVMLLIIAAFLFGVRINNLVNRKSSLIPAPPIPSALPNTLTNTANIATGELHSYSNNYCGVALTYPDSLTLQEATNAARFINTGSNETIDLACSKELPKPPLSANKIEEASVAGVKAMIYYDANARDGSPRDVVIFTQPNKQLEVALFGFGEVFKSILASVRLLP